MAITVSQLSQTIEVLIPIDEVRDIRARKSVKLGAKNTSSTYSEQLDYLVGTDGVLTGLELSLNGMTLSIGAGSFIGNGQVAISDDNTSVVDTGALIEPYYLVGYIVNDSSTPSVIFELDQDTTGDAVLIGTKDSGTWVRSHSIQLGHLWDIENAHEDNNELHTDANVELYLQSPTSATGSNAYATKSDLYTYDRAIDSNDILTSLISLMELESNTSKQKPHKFHFGNMFADVIPVSHQIKLSGKYGTFIDAVDASNEEHLGLSGIYNDSGIPFVFETGVIKKVDNLTNNILLTTKQTLVGAGAGVEFDLSTDGSTYQLTGLTPDFVVDSTSLASLTKSPDDTYNLAVRFSIPAVSGGNYWVTKQSLTNDTAMAASRFMNNRTYTIGGYNGAGTVEAGIQEYDSFSDTVKIFASSLDRHQITTSRDLAAGKINIFNGSNYAGTIQSGMLELTMSNQAISNVGTGLSLWGSTSAQAAHDSFCSVFGTGVDAGSTMSNTWRGFNNATKAISSKTDFPAAMAGVSSEGVESIPQNVYCYGGRNSAGTTSSLTSYNVVNNSFIGPSPVELGSPDTTSHSYAESFKATLKRTLISAGRSTGVPFSESFDNETTEYNIFQNTLSKRANMDAFIGHVALSLAANGKMYGSGGRTSNAGATLSSNTNFEYTHNAMIYMYGWAMEWL